MIIINIYLYRANSTLQFSNAPYNKRTIYYKYIKYNNIWSKFTGKKIMSNLQITIISEKSFSNKMSLQITFKNIKIRNASKI